MAAQSQYVGQRVSYDGALCTIRYVGLVAGTKGSWLGVEWDDASRGKHDGSHKGQRYFTCLSKSPTAASFIRPNRPLDPTRSFIEALKAKYASDPSEENEASSANEIIISGKVAQEIGFDKIRRQLGQVHELKIIILDGMRITTAVQDGDSAIGETAPKISQLDLSRNLFERFGPVVDICRELKMLHRLVINGNRFQHALTDEALSGSRAAFKWVQELQLAETLLSWEELCHVASNFPALSSFNVGSNRLSLLPALSYNGISSTLTSLNLEYNNFTAISQLGNLSALKVLRNLHLKGNNVAVMAPPGEDAAVFPASLQFLDVSYNDVQSWSFVDSIPTHFPGLTALRLTHNPVYDQQDAESGAPSTEESHMFTIARVAQLNSLNFSTIKPADRANAEMFYLSRIAKQLATVPESAEDTVLVRHPRYADLCEIYGAPDIIRREEVNPSFLEARLVSVSFREGGTTKKRTSRIPKSFDIYAVKGIAGKLFGVPPLRIRLIWETGEWDPVAGFDEAEEDTSDDDDDIPSIQDESGGDDGLESEEEKPADKSGRWIKREVELKDGPKQLGYCVDGSDVVIRLEVVER